MLFFYSLPLIIEVAVSEMPLLVRFLARELVCLLRVINVELCDYITQQP